MHPYRLSVPIARRTRREPAVTLEDALLDEALRRWDLNHAVVWLLPAVTVLYARGFCRAHRQMPERYPLWRLAAFWGGTATLFVAIASPLDALGELLLHLHMTQHMLLLMVAPPLIWLGQPIVPLLRGIPPRLAARTFGGLFSSRLLRSVGRAITHPAFCWSAFAVTVIVWHLPTFYELGLHSEAWHSVQHGCFLSASLLFWWPVIGVWPSHARWPRWTAIPYLVTADLINTALSAVLTFSTHVLYTSYANGPRILNLSALDDQALAGVIMWVPGSIAFLLPAIVLAVRLFEPQPRATMSRSPSWVGQ
jgi:cytochrome c oxidase assembly factor CtaG